MAKAVIRPLPSIEEKNKRTVIALKPKEAEALSVEAQKEMGVYG